MSPALVALAALAALARALPAHLEIRTVDLSQALNHTVCPIEVHVDVNNDRIPRRIKMLKCAPDPNLWCKKENIPQHECCHHNHDHHQMQCVQVQDTVLVQFKDGTSKAIEVPVGCSCMISKASVASSVSYGPS